MITRDLKPSEIGICANLVETCWGREAADRARDQMIAMFSGGHDVPHFYVAAEGLDVWGFAGLRRSWVMKDTFELIWIAVNPNAQGRGLGKALVQRRLDEIAQRGGSLVYLMTKEVDFFQRFGFDATVTFDDEYTFMVKRLAPIGI